VGGQVPVPVRVNGQKDMRLRAFLSIHESGHGPGCDLCDQ
jgi:hypothetical protein